MKKSNPKIVKATDAEKAAYLATKPTYPLYGYAHFAGQKLVIETVTDGADYYPECKYCVLCPKGFRFGAYGTTMYNTASLKDLAEHVRAYFEQGEAF